MKTLAAVLVETGRALELAELEIPVLKPGQVLVEIAFSGVCHTQLLESRGHRGKDAFLPHCLGHEGSGKVLELGDGVSKVKRGERVILSWMKGSGADVPGTKYRWDGRDVNAGALTTFSRHAVVSENRLTHLPEGLALGPSALLGCAIPTGVGSVLNAAGAKAGQSLVVFGAGGIGLCAIAGARLAGCAPIVAVDMRADRLALARKLGATQTILASDGDPVAAILKLVAGGADFAIEATGRPAVMSQALACVRPRGGAAVVVGNARAGEKIELDPGQLNQGKRLLGTWGGDNVPDRDFPRYCEWLASGKLDVGPMISASYPLSRINDALDDLESGRAARPLIEMSDTSTGAAS
jgi:S-(hydroxymethyl)glutathione dehydrogenase/alcohol dehydrogenase